MIKEAHVPFPMVPRALRSSPVTRALRRLFPLAQHSDLKTLK